MRAFFNSKKSVIVLACILGGFFAYKYLNSVFQYKYYSAYSIAKCTGIETQNASTYAMYEFHVENRKIIGATYIKGEANISWVNKYFRIRYSTKNPKINEVMLDQKITDTTAIKAAGFTLPKKKR